MKNTTRKKVEEQIRKNYANFSLLDPTKIDKGEKNVRR